MSVMEASNLTIEHFKRMFEQGKRFDGRTPLQLRSVTIECNVSNKAEGSARVRMGKTEVLAGVKLALGAPYPDSPDKGNLIVSGDLLPLASPRFESGPPGFSAIELPRLLDRAIRESGMIDMHKMVITPGEKVWTLYIDVYPINDDGNLVDAATIACIAALKSAVIPGITEQGLVDYDNRTKENLPISKETAPLSFSFFKLGNALIMDPTREEEEVMETRITFGVSKWNGQYMINSCQKSGAGPLTRADVERISALLPEKYDEMEEKLKKFF
ncbi:MAG TPA: exosome complex protein Rrp42 [Candidatus Nanoarchaeia archaeon]|nr:exosome complex protein Rrp42 [Candidatus Nanoarchaeia archaeon]